MVRPLDGAPSAGFDSPEGPVGARPRGPTADASSQLPFADAGDIQLVSRPPLLSEQAGDVHLAHVLDAPAGAINLRFLTHRPDMLGLPAAHLVYGLRALGRWIRRSKAEPGELERWIGGLLGVDPGDIKRPAADPHAAPTQLSLADALANHVEDELASCGLYPSLAAHIHQALPRSALSQLLRASQSGSAWLAFTTYPEFCLKRGLGAAADPRFRTATTKPKDLPLAEAVVTALSPGLDPASRDAITQEVAIAVTAADMQGLLAFARSDLANAWIHLQPALRQRADAIFARPEVQQRLGERLRRAAVPVRTLRLRAPRFRGGASGRA